MSLSDGAAWEKEYGEEPRRLMPETKIIKVGKEEWAQLVEFLPIGQKCEDEFGRCSKITSSLRAELSDQTELLFIKDIPRILKEHDEKQLYKDTEALFQLQWKRVAEATRVWQMETGQPDILPDLGDLVQWLMKKAGLSVQEG